MTILQQMVAGQSNQELRINEIVESLSVAGLFSKRHAAASGTTWAWYGGRYNGNTVADGSAALTTSATNFVVANRQTGAVTISTATTNWNDNPNFARLYQITLTGSVVTAVVDNRLDTGGLFTQEFTRQFISKSIAYTFVLADANCMFLHPSADTTARTWTIPANGSVAYPVGTELEIVNQNAAGTLTIAITTDTMRLEGAGTTGSRTLTANGRAKALKVATAEWLISGGANLT